MVTIKIRIEHMGLAVAVSSRVEAVSAAGTKEKGRQQKMILNTLFSWRN